MKKKNWLIFGAVFVVIAFLLAFKYSAAQSTGASGSGQAALSSDAIAVRVVPNPNHYSIQRWYESQGFSGSPQALIVDGYEAIRDGRTVYVNAANVDPISKLVYSNIYLISYNQSSESKTVDILGQIVAHWKFNSNIPESTNPLPSCSISSLSCASDADCGANQGCATANLASSSCQLTTTKNCLTDTDCPTNFFCDSVKAKIARDLKRVGRLEEIKEALFQYKQTQGAYPLLSAGSYLTGHSVSVWPSWLESLLSTLSISQPTTDPINRLGACPGYNPITCWSAELKKFVYNSNSAYLPLPAGSYALVYKTDKNGSNYNLCAVMESRDASSPMLGYHFSPNDPAASACVTATGINSGGNATNTPPRLVASSLTGVAGQEFNGFVRMIDDQNNPLTWNFNPSGTTWTGWQNNSQNNPPVLKDTTDPNQKKIYASLAGNPGTYNAVLTVSDGQGGVFTTTTPLKIINPAPVISAADGEFVLDPLVPFDYNFVFSGANINNPGAAYTVVKIAGPFDLLNGAGLTKIMTSAGIASYRIDYNGLIATTFRFYQNTDFTYKITVTDKYGVFATKLFTIHVIVDNPPVDCNCSNAARLNSSYSCLLGSDQFGNHSLSYTSSPLPAGLSLASGQSSGSGNGRAVSLKQSFGNLARAIFNFFIKTSSAINTTLPPATHQPTVTYLSGTPTATSTGTNIIIKATNEYGASSTRAFILSINDYCGDGLKQVPNMEGRGGFYNDGFEDCDGAASVATSPAASSIDKQYGCTTGVGSTTPLLIPNGSYCVFKSPAAGGGYCGDGYCQLIIPTATGTTTMETTTNCADDCVASSTPPTCAAHQSLQNNICVCDLGWYDCDGKPLNGCESQDSGCGACTQNCIGKECGPDGCGGVCGTCAANQMCNPAGHCTGQPNCHNNNTGCDLCGATTGCSCPTGYTCKNNVCLSQLSCKCVNQAVSSSYDVCQNPRGTAFNTCCTQGSETCCSGACQADPTQNKLTCGYGPCCNKDTQTCCGSGMSNRTCYNNSELTPKCGSTYCCPGQVCCNGQYGKFCTSDPTTCTGNQQ